MEASLSPAMFPLATKDMSAGFSAMRNASEAMPASSISPTFSPAEFIELYVHSG